MSLESELLIECPHCANEGFRRLDDGGYGPCVCRMARVVGTGRTVAQVERWKALAAAPEADAARLRAAAEEALEAFYGILDPLEEGRHERAAGAIRALIGALGPSRVAAVATGQEIRAGLSEIGKGVSMATTTATHTLTIPRWRPALLNELLGAHRMAAARRKKGDRAMVAAYARKAGIPEAEGRRRVSLVLPGAPSGKLPDPDGVWKSLLDALAEAGLLVDDSGRWCEMGPVRFERGGADTTITLEDLGR